MLDDEGLLHYSRQTLLVQVDVGGQLRPKRGRVPTVSPGGLGSSVALYLTVAGVGGLYLVDLDMVDLTNLQRQVIHGGANVGTGKVKPTMHRLDALNLQIHLVSHSAALDEDSLDAVMMAVDSMLDCTDNFVTHETANIVCMRAGKPLVSGVTTRFENQFSVLNTHRDVSPCYHCPHGYSSEAELTCSEVGVIGPLVGLVGSP